MTALPPAAQVIYDDVTRAYSPPSGRILYRAPDHDDNLCGLYRYEGDPRLFIMSRDPFYNEIAGPFYPNDALRALRLANLEVPDGCSLMGWRPALTLLFDVIYVHREYFELDPRTLDQRKLPHSLSRYTPDDIQGEGGGCCSAPTNPPLVRWTGNRRGALSTTAQAAHETMVARHPELRRARLGALKREWNAHPAGSLLYMPGALLETSGFLVVDF